MLYIQMANNIMDSIIMASGRVKANMYMLMEINIKVILRIIKSMELVNLHIKIKGNIMVYFVNICRAVGEWDEAWVRNL